MPTASLRVKRQSPDAVPRLRRRPISPRTSGAEAYTRGEIVWASVDAFGPRGEFTEGLGRFRREHEALADLAIHDFHRLPFAGRRPGLRKLAHERTGGNLHGRLGV